MQYDQHVQAFKLHKTLVKLHRTIKAAQRKPRKAKVIKNAVKALLEMPIW